MRAALPSNCGLCFGQVAGASRAVAFWAFAHFKQMGVREPIDQMPFEIRNDMVIDLVVGVGRLDAVWALIPQLRRQIRVGTIAARVPLEAVYVPR